MVFFAASVRVKEERVPEYGHDGYHRKKIPVDLSDKLDAHVAL